MAGEPSWFNVTKLECFEIETVGGAHFPSPIIDWGEQFYWKVSFGGPATEPLWLNMTGNGFGYVIQFYAEGMGHNVADLELIPPTQTGNLVRNQFEYEVDSPVYTFDTEGIYRCGVTVTFRMPNGVGRWRGILGFNEDCVIQINAEEEHG